MNSKVMCLSTHAVKREIDLQAVQLRRAVAFIEQSRARTATLLASVERRLQMLGTADVTVALTTDRVCGHEAVLNDSATGPYGGGEVRAGLMTLHGQARELDDKLHAQWEVLHLMMARLERADPTADVPSF